MMSLNLARRRSSSSSSLQRTPVRRLHEHPPMHCMHRVCVSTAPQQQASKRLLAHALPRKGSSWLSIRHACIISCLLHRCGCGASLSKKWLAGLLRRVGCMAGCCCSYALCVCVALGVRECRAFWLAGAGGVPIGENVAHGVRLTYLLTTVSLSPMRACLSLEVGGMWTL